MFEKKRGTRFLASVMALVMLLSLAPVGALAADGETPTNEECPAVTQPAVGDENQQDVADEENTPPPPHPAVNPNSAEATNEATKLEEDLDEGFSVGADDADTSNDIAEQNLSLNKAPKKQSITAEFWLTNRHAKVGDVWKMTITKDMVGNDGTAVTNLAPPERRATADETYDTVFWQARVLSNWQRQTTENDDDKTASGTEIVSIRYNNGLEYQAKNSTTWDKFNKNDQLVFYYLIRTDYTEMVQIDVSDWTVKNEPTSINDRHSVTYQVIVDGGKDNGKVLDSQKFWYNKGFTVSAVRVRQTASNNYTISKVELAPTDLGTVAKENDEYQFSLNLKNASTDEATVKIYVKPNVQPKHLSYELGGGTITSNANDYTVAGEVYPDAPVVTPSVSKDGYTFGGWYTDADFQNQWTGTTMPNENLMLHAKWTATNPDPKPDPDPDPTPKATPVYVYFKIVDAAGNNIKDKSKINNDDLKKTVYNAEAGGATWATLGKIALTGDITEDTLTNAGEAAQVQLKNANNLWSKNKDIAQTVLANVQWFKLKQWAGATDYEPDGSRWHLDGKITGYTVTYNKGTTEATADDVHNMPVDEMYYLRDSEYTVSDVTPTRDGYVFTGWKSNIENNTTIYNAKGKFEMPAKNVVLTAQWAEDNWKDADETTDLTDADSENGGDGIPDRYQVKILYVSAAQTKGTVSPLKMEIKTIKDVNNNFVSKGTVTATGSTATVTDASLYEFVKWTKDTNEVGTNAQLENYQIMDAEGGHTYIFTANFKDKKIEPPTSEKAQYTVKHYKWDTQKKEYTLANTDVIDSTVGTVVTAKAKAYDGGYILNEQKSKQTKSGTVLEGNTLTLKLYYDVDKIGKGENLDQPDGTIDRYQVTIIYKSSDESKGTVSTKKEVLTIKKADNEKTLLEDVMIKGSKATDNGGRNYFSNWTDEVNNKTINDATLTADTIKKAIETAEGGETYTFTANFDRSSGGGSGGSNRPKPPVVDIPDDVPTGLNGKDHYAYIIGYGNNDVRPQNNITRAEVATIFFRLLTDETREANMTKSNGYNDVKDGDWFCCAVSTLSKMGIIKGYEDGSFKPNDPISRAEFAAIAARFDPNGDKTPASFSDVTSHWAKDEISIAANHGWIKGYEDGSFKPDQKITRAETMTLVNRVLKRLPETKDDLHKDMKTWPDNQNESAWFYLAVQEATNSHYQKLKKDGTHEKWESMRETRDWAALEK